jgi:uncharacterized protein (DUF885 family)
VKIRSAVVVGALAVCLGCAGPVETNSAAMNRLFDEYYEFLLRSSPELATDVGRKDYNDRWTDYSRDGRDAYRAEQRSFLDRANEIPTEDLTEQEGVSRSLMIADLEQSLEGRELEDYLLSMNQLFGLHVRVPLTIAEMPADTVEDYENIIARIEATPAYADQAIALLKEAIGAGITQPRYIGEMIAGQIETQAGFDAADSPLLAAFRDFPEEVDPGRREVLTDSATRAYVGSFQPAWRKLAAFMRETYAPAGRAELAASSLPDGAKRYAYLVRRYTTTDLTPDQIHELGLKEVERIDAQMDEIARSQGYKDADAYERMLNSSPAQRFSSKEEMLEYCRNIAKLVDPGLPQLFLKLPRMPFGIRPIPEDTEAASASNYQQPASDGSRAAWFNLKAYRPTTQVRFDKTALVLHETNPGHHLQIGLQLEMENMPEFRKIYSATAYIEGWALYAESLGERLGVYEDPANRFGALDSERFRARRLVVDTGIHAKGWTHEQAVAYLGDESEVNRYVAWPGQALAYKIGQLKILELRERMKQQLGERFDIRKFHDLILRNGPLPLDLLEARVLADAN